MSKMQDLYDIPASALSRVKQVPSAGILQFLDISPDPLVVVNQAGTIVMANEQIATLFGYPREVLLEQPLEMLLPQCSLAVHVNHWERYFPTPRLHSMGTGLELFGQCQDGTEFPVDVSLRPIIIDGLLHVIGAIRNLARQRFIEHERLQLSQTVHLQSKLINLAHDAILVRDPESCIISWNTGAERLYGWIAQEVTGKVTHTLLQTRFPISQQAVDQALEQHGEWEGGCDDAFRRWQTGNNGLFQAF